MSEYEAVRAAKESGHQQQFAGSLTQIYVGADKLAPLAPVPDKAFMSAVPFSSHEDDQPQDGTFLLRMSGSFYHPGGASKLFIKSAPANAVAAIYMNGEVLPTGDFNLTEGNHLLDVRYAALILSPRQPAVSE